MGRRVTATTKGGKFMNPTDQARKEARRRELRKNKKQRLAVRQAVIKTKDPRQMLVELDTLDEMELNPSQNLPYNDKVVKEKRIKLLENIERITQYYLREDPQQGVELRRLVDNYRKERLKKEVYYESVRNAQRVKIDTIPLPDAPFQTPQLNDIPLPGIQPQGILKKQTMYVQRPPEIKKKEIPGPPPGPPPSKKRFKDNNPALHFPRPPPGMPPTIVQQSSSEDKEIYDQKNASASLDDENSDDDKSEDEFCHRDDENDLTFDSSKKKRRQSKDTSDVDDGVQAKFARTVAEASGITPLQAMMLKLAGQSMPLQKGIGESQANTEEDGGKSDEASRKVAFANPPPGATSGHLQSRIMPPGPPPGHPPALPAGPPPGMPLNPLHLQSGGKAVQERYGAQTSSHGGVISNVLSAPPSLIHHRQDRDNEGMPAIIVAKPKIINNPKADVTRFMPTSLRVKRQNIGKSGQNKAQVTSTNASTSEKRKQEKKMAKVNADVAYDSFMKEMQGFL